MSLLRGLEIAKIGLSENLTYLLSGIFANISRREKFPIYGILTVFIMKSYILVTISIYVLVKYQCPTHSGSKVIRPRV